jgi:hypothetical protein
MSSEWDDIVKILDKIDEEGKYLPEKLHEKQFERRWKEERLYREWRRKREHAEEKRHERIIFMICLIAGIFMCLFAMLAAL